MPEPEDNSTNERELLAQLHRLLVNKASELVERGDWSLAMQLIKHNGITAPQVSERGTMRDAAQAASKLNFRPRERVVPLRTEVPRVSPE